MDDSNRQSNPDREDPAGADTNRSMSRQDWEDLPANPDPREDLGYELSDLEAYETDGDVVILPTDEDMLREDAFVVIDEADVVTPVE